MHQMIPFFSIADFARCTQATGSDGINIIQNNGAASGQAVFHAHIHVIPRFKDDGVIRFPAGKAMIEKEDGAALLAKIQGKL